MAAVHLINKHAHPFYWMSRQIPRRGAYRVRCGLAASRSYPVSKMSVDLQRRAPRSRFPRRVRSPSSFRAASGAPCSPRAVRKPRGKRAVASGSEEGCHHAETARSPERLKLPPRADCIWTGILNIPGLLVSIMMNLFFAMSPMDTISSCNMDMEYTIFHYPSNPAGRRKEIDNVMKRARQASPGSWDRKLLEVEEKDPNRWRHTGYKQLYLDGSPSSSPRRSRTPLPRRSRSPIAMGRRSRTPIGRRSRSPIGLGRRSRSPVGLGRRSRSPIGLRRSRSPIGLGRRTRSPMGLGRRSRSPVGLGRRTRSPVVLGRRSPVRKSRSRGHRSRSRSLRSPRRSPRRGGSPVRKSSPRRSPRGRRSPPPSTARPRSPPAKPAARRETPSRVRSTAGVPASRQRAGAPRGARPPSPPDPPAAKSSPSGSSMSSCSDESCSVCSAKNKRLKPKPSRPSPPPKRPERAPAKPSAAQAKVLTKPLNSGNANAKPSSLPLQPTRELLKAREASKRTREEKVLEWQRSQLNVARAPPPTPPTSAPIPARRIKREGERRPPSATRAARGVSPGAIAAALADHSEEEDDTSASSEPPPQRLTLSERFGKMAQWSADRSARLENMRITRRDAGLHVRIERPPGSGGAPDDPLADDEPPPEPYPLDPAPVGSYPEELLAVAPSGLPSWDDVRVRYDYYKKRGYLRGDYPAHRRTGIGQSDELAKNLFLEFPISV
ncbi:hypothetical protein EVAR_53452_1 [Eumeta japonica]|uniref:Uncharacterized protein n=1 Tax=Eumeta variegata TaxID=151549 RepID=A0A4C1XRG5_EUMVA|nr:hypothetical protein EVAR_53452_1 [Eumeta japonica]